jgi:hypothetical protein
MAYTQQADISRLLVAGQKEIFMKNLEAYPTEYPTFMNMKTSNKAQETYDSIGNLKAAEKKIEGGSINYGKVTQAYQTTIINETFANGYEITIEANMNDLYGAINSIKAKELARTMRELEETESIYWVDNASTVNLADGVPLASNSHPLIDSAELNDTLATASSLAVPDNHKTMINMFYDFKNHAGGFMKCKPSKGLTHYTNQMVVEEVYKSINKAQEMSNTKNTLPTVSFNYSTYMNSRTAWMMWDNKFEHFIFQKRMGTEFHMEQEKLYTYNYLFNAIEMFGTGCLPQPGFVYNAGA